LAAVPSMGFGKAGDGPPQRRLGEPIGNPAAQNAAAQGALTGDNQDRAMSFALRAHDESGERQPGAVLVKTMKIDERG
jgi:hypothetical protein